MYRWCSHCNTKYKPGTYYCTNPKCKNNRTGQPWETDVEFEPDDILKDLRRHKSFRVMRRLSTYANAGMSAIYLVQRADKGREHKRAVIKVTKVKAHLPVLRREVYHLQRLKHHNIIRLAYGTNMVDPDDAIFYDRQDGQTLYFIALEYLPGGSVKDIISPRKPLSLEQSAFIVIQIAQALDYIHRQGVVHLDIKPANILFDGHGRVVLADFGVARTQHNLNRFTSSGNMGSSIPGTPAYNAPEKCQNVITDSRADVFALGLSFFEMLIGDPPIQHRLTTGSGLKPSSPPRTGVKRCVNVAELPEPHIINKNISADVEKVIAKAIHPNRDKRYSTAGAFAKDLQQFVKPEAIKLPAYEKSPRKHRMLWMIVGVLLLLTVIGGGIFTFGIPNIGKFIVTASPTQPVAISSATRGSIFISEKDENKAPPATATSKSFVNALPSATSSARMPAVTSTLAKVPSPTPKPTRTPTTVLTPTPASSIVVDTVPQIIAMNANIAGNQIEFQWRWTDNSCIFPPDGYGFEIRFWPDQPGVDPLGAMDAQSEQDRIGCSSGVFKFRVMQMSLTPGARIANSNNHRFKWDVSLVQLDPYKIVKSSDVNIISVP